MSDRYPGGIIVANPTAPTTSSAPGVWTLEQASYYIAQGTWPLPPTPDPYFEYVTLLLNGGSTNGAQNNTFVDSSTNNFTITRNGNTTQGSFSPYGSLWSNYFDGSSCLSFPSNTAFAYGTGDFTIEFWLYWGGAGTQCVFATGNLNASNSLQIYTDGAGTTNMTLTAQFSGSPEYSVQTATFTKSTWHHCALVRASGTSQFYIDGVASGSSASTPADLTVTSAVKIGDMVLNSTPSQHYYFTSGYVSNFRSTKGGALYSSTFTPSTTPLTTSVSSGTVGLLTCQSNRFVDNSSNAFAITLTGTPLVLRFGPFDPTASYDTATIGGSGYFDGSGDYLTMPNNAAFNLSGTSSWTVSCSVYFSTLTTYAAVLTLNTGTVDWVYFKDADGYMELHMNGGGRFIDNNTVIKAGQWYDFTLTYDGSNVRHYINGVLDSTVACASITSYTPSPAMGSNGTSNYMTGYIGGIRIVKGYVNAPSGVSTSPYTAVTGTTFLAKFQNAGIADAAMMNDLETVGNAQVSTSVIKYGTGSLSFDGTGDYLTMPNSPVYWFGIGNFTVETWVYINSNQAYATIIDTTGGGGSNNGWFIEYSATRGLIFFFGTGSSQILVEFPTTPPTNTWQHIAVCRSGGIVYVYLNGVSAASSSIATIGNPPTTTPVYIGSGGAQYYLNGYLYDLRITKGYARYPNATTFTPPTAALPTF